MDGRCKRVSYVAFGRVPLPQRFGTSDVVQHRSSSTTTLLRVPVTGCLGLVARVRRSFDRCEAKPVAICR